MSNDESIYRVIAESLEARKLVFFFGAGLGMDAGLLGPNDIVENVNDEFDIEIRDFNDLKEGFSNSRRSVRTLDQHIKNLLIDATDEIENDVLDTIASFINITDVEDVITTNYDELLEYNSKKSKYYVIKSAQDLISCPDDKLTKIYKLCGCVTDNESLGYDEMDFRACSDKNPALFAKITTLVTEKDIVMVGYNGKESFFADFLIKSADIKGAEKRIYFISPFDESNYIGKFERFAKVEQVKDGAILFLSNITNAYEKLMRERTKITKKDYNPTNSIQKKIEVNSSRNEKNPFFPYKSDDIFEEDLISNFETPPESISKHLVPNGTSFIYGSKGTGKTAILKSMCLKTKIIHSKRCNVDVDFGTFSVYMRFDKAEIQTNIYSDDNVDEWKRWYKHYFNLCISSELVDVIDELYNISAIENKNGIFDFMSNHLFLELNEKGIKHSLEIERAKSRYKWCNQPLSTEIFLIEVFEYIRRNNENFRNSTFLALFDDVAFSDERIEFFKAFANSRVNIGTKLATSKKKVLKSLYGLDIDYTHDYTLVDLNVFFNDSDTKSDYQKYAEKIVKKRLASKGIKLDANQLFPANNLSDKDTNTPIYAGFKNITLMSMGTIRNLLHICKIIYENTVGSNEKPQNITYIKPSDQEKYLIQHSTHRRNQLRRVMSDSKASEFLDSLGFAFASRNQTYESQDNIRFGIRDPENISKRIKDLLDKLVDEGVLYEGTERKNQNSANIVNSEQYVLNRALCPYYKLPLIDHHQKMISSEQLELAVTDRSSFLKVMV
ncbi:SIR2 family protein [Vibrio sinaloensis]|uniref:ORC-CDC6 family AAA ATPase n=1 Tax=Photobacterium sp. (strain ATCC 43367) TaxID=379097 RepID=UPI00057F53D8|nr:SIR2 family protein [Vibrio sinaloensis]KHT48593.1 hypothetical protein RJ46_10330 [Vibrio sinaloensis]